MSANEIRRSLEEKEAIAGDRDKLSVHAAKLEKEIIVIEDDDVVSSLIPGADESPFEAEKVQEEPVVFFHGYMDEKQGLARDHNLEVDDIKVPPKRPANVLEKEIIVIEDDDVVLSLIPGADESPFEAEKGQEDPEVDNLADLTERETKRPRLYNEVPELEEEDDEEEEDDDDDDGDEEDEGCLKFKASVIDSSLESCRKIGAGGYGAVYKAFINGEEVAIKILHSTSAMPDTYARHFGEFETEVNVLGKIRHHNLVRLIGCCKKRRAIVYEYLCNGTLEELIQIHKKRFPWKARVSVACSICEVLVFLHSRSEPVVHGDLKPSNILFDSSNVLKLSDFGISRILKLTSGSGTRMHITVDGPKGTRNYMDPEYSEFKCLTSHSDTYAFGVIILQLVTGKTANDLIEFVESAMSSCQPKESGVEELLKNLDEAKLIDIALRKRFSVGDTLDALELVKLGLECCRLSRRSRPSLVDDVFPKLKQLNEKLKQK